MGLTTIPRGYKVPVALLDQFLEANGQDATHGQLPLSAEAANCPGEERLLQAEGVRDIKGEDLTVVLYVVVTDERMF
ncbi:uncharacterized protein B0H64DRAFT_473693 [Chaetomium fimeti]|uniref:Uncharacterized protein n=1 Tax=Chaetomium fimeti TaxID=1854472 RepID=A0AAE0LU42_9PEZI|nr:hypothetical protein B0H64DRAFT_473693 [Chaetomium fimeti]